MQGNNHFLNKPWIYKDNTHAHISQQLGLKIHQSAGEVEDLIQKPTVPTTPSG